MVDEKKKLREDKKIVKKAGNRKRRHFLKDLSNQLEDFDFGNFSSKPLNTRKRKAN